MDTAESSAYVMTAEMTQSEREFRIVAAVPGCDEKHLRVTATGSLIVVEGTLPPVDPCGSDQAIFNEFAGRRVVRTFRLPEEIAQEEVKAHLRNGLLTIVAVKARLARSRRVALAAVRS